MDHETIILDGVERSLGLLTHPCGRQSLSSFLEDKVSTWSEAAISNWAIKNGGKRAKFFDSSWIENQGSNGSCAGYAAASCLSKARVLRGLSRVDLSGAYLYSRCNGGRNNGSMLSDHQQAVEKFGACRETTVTVNQIFRSHYDTRTADAEALQYRAHEAYGVQTRLGLMTAIAMGFPCEVAVHVGGDFGRFDANGYPRESNGGGNHAIHVDDLVVIDGKIAFCAVNSWGVSWGSLQGRMFLDWDRHLARPWENHVAFGIRSTLDG